MSANPNVITGLVRTFGRSTWSYRFLAADGRISMIPIRPANAGPIMFAKTPTDFSSTSVPTTLPSGSTLTSSGGDGRIDQFETALQKFALGFLPSFIETGVENMLLITALIGSNAGIILQAP